MTEIRFHGRGGQGAVMASLILAGAAHRQGCFVQSFPEFGVERRGAPVSAFLRLDDQPILIRCRILNPDHLIVLDPLLLHVPATLKGLKPGGSIILNLGTGASAKAGLQEFHRLIQSNGWKAYGVEASEIAAACGIGGSGYPLANTAMVGAYAKATGLVHLESVVEAIRANFPDDGGKNIRAAKESYEKTRAWIEERRS